MQDGFRARQSSRRGTRVVARAVTPVAARDLTPRAALRWAVLTFGAAGALLVARDVRAQSARVPAAQPAVRPVARPAARPGTRPRPRAPRATTATSTAPSDSALTGATAVGSAPAGTTPSGRPIVGPPLVGAPLVGAPTAGAPTVGQTAAPTRADTAAGEVVPSTVPVAVAGDSAVGVVTPRIDLHPPNVAGRLETALSRADVIAPIDAPIGGGSGAALMHAQVLLDAARFSPGAISGVWNENTLFALHAFRAAAHLPPGDSIDADVIARLERVAGARAPVTDYVVTEADVRGPYRRLPGTMYAKAKVDCLCYQSMIEMLGERFHTTPDALRRLNADVDVARARAGTRLVVPNVERGAAPTVVRLVVNKTDGSLRGLDARGATRFWLPVTVGSPSLPSPNGRLRVVSATLNPRYQYDPVVLGEVRGSRPNALLAPGPNSPVGVLWAQLSRPHVGLHGTPDPEDVGYTMSHGCVRMANWDARWLTPVLRPGLIVDFL